MPTSQIRFAQRYSSRFLPATSPASSRVAERVGPSCREPRSPAPRKKGTFGRQLRKSALQQLLYLCTTGDTPSKPELIDVDLSCSRRIAAKQPHSGTAFPQLEDRVGAFWCGRSCTWPCLRKLAAISSGTDSRGQYDLPMRVFWHATCSNLRQVVRLEGRTRL